MSAPRARGAKARAEPASKLADRHAHLATLLLRAEQAPDPLERALAVCRALLALATDVARPGRGYAETPVVILGSHALGHRDLAERHRGDGVRAYLQELAGYDPGDRPTRHPKLEPSSPEDAPIAVLELSAAPAASARAPKAGLLLGGGGPASVEVGLRGGGTVSFPRHEERYTFTLPALHLGAPLEKECPLELQGALELACPATGISASLRFRPGRGVEGAVRRTDGAAGRDVAAVSGDWDGQVSVVCPELDASGVLFDAAQGASGPLPSPPAVDLASPGPRLMPRLWSAVLEALTCIDPGAAAAEGGRKAEALARALPGHLRAALGYEVAQGPKSAPAAAASAADDDEEEEEGEGGGGAGPDPRHLPPSALAQRALGRGLTYQLRYDLRALPQG